MKKVRKLAGKKGETSDEEEGLEEALQLAALDASAVAEAAMLSSGGGTSPQRQQWLAEQKEYSIRMNLVVSPFMAQIAAEHADELDSAVQAFTTSTTSKKPRPKSSPITLGALNSKEAQRLQKEFTKEEKLRRKEEINAWRKSVKANAGAKIKREPAMAFAYLPSQSAGGGQPQQPYITERLSASSGSAAQDLFDVRTLRGQISPSPLASSTPVPLQPLSTMRPRSMCIRDVVPAFAALAEPITGDTTPTSPPVLPDDLPPLPPRE